VKYAISDITVVMCTSERYELAVTFIRDFVTKFVNTKLIVVENSLDEKNLKKLIQEFHHHENLTLIRSNPPGLSRARNFGLSLVDTHLVAFTDDDCIPDKRWLTALATSRLWDQVSAIGGPIQPIFPNGFDRGSLPNDLVASLAILDLGKSAKVLEIDQDVYGANMCFAVEHLTGIDFDENLGRKGSSLLSGEEVAFLSQLREMGLSIGYDPEAIVRHKISADRLEPSWFLSRFAWQGVSDASSGKDDYHKWNRSALDYHASRIGVKPAIDALLEDSDHFIEDRAKVLRYLIFHALNLTTGRVVEEVIPDSSYYLPIKPKIQNLVFDYQGFHDFLGVTLTPDDFTFYNSAHEPWGMTTAECMSEIRYLRDTHLSSAQDLRVIFLTLDNMLHDAYFSSFKGLLESDLKIVGLIHRIPNKESLEKLLQIQSEVNLLTFSEHILAEMNSFGIDIKLTSLPGRYFSHAKHKNRILENKITKVAIPGEIRSTESIGYLRLLLDHVKLNDIDIEIHLIGGVRSKKIYKDILELHKDFNKWLKIDNVQEIRQKFRVVPERSYISSILLCDLVFKIQFEEYTAASSVVSDAISLNRPVMAIYNTESANMISEIFPELVVPDLNPLSFFSVIDNFDRRKYCEVDKIILGWNQKFEKDLLS
jgi:hypothetical protein